jgi:hypothetical protein
MVAHFEKCFVPLSCNMLVNVSAGAQKLNLPVSPLSVGTQKGFTNLQAGAKRPYSCLQRPNGPQ